MEAINVREWLLTVVKEREHLLKTGKSKRSILPLASITERIKLYLHNNSYTDEQMLRFVARHKVDILMIIPGEPSRSHKKHLETFLKIISHDTNIN